MKCTINSQLEMRACTYIIQNSRVVCNSVSNWICLTKFATAIASRDFPDVARASFFKGTGGLMAGSTQSKRWRIELLYRYKRAKTSRITVLNIWKLYHYFAYFKLCLLLMEPASSLGKWCACIIWKKII